MAAAGGYSDVVRALAEAGAELNVATDNGFTALMVAAFSGHTDAVAALLDAGADTERRNANGLTALTMAQARGHSEVVGLLEGDGRRGAISTVQSLDDNTPVVIRVDVDATLLYEGQELARMSAGEVRRITVAPGERLLPDSPRSRK